MDGFGSIKALKPNPAAEEVPLIFTTGNSYSRTRADSFRPGAADFVSKPFGPEILGAGAVTRLALSRQRQRLESRGEPERLNLEMSAKEAEKADRAVRLPVALSAAAADLPESRRLPRRGRQPRRELARAVDRGHGDEVICSDEIRPWNRSALLRSSLLHDAGKYSASELIPKKPGRPNGPESGETNPRAVRGAAFLDRPGSGLPEGAGQFIHYARTLGPSRSSAANAGTAPGTPTDSLGTATRSGGGSWPPATSPFRSAPARPLPERRGREDHNLGRGLPLRPGPGGGLRQSPPRVPGAVTGPAPPSRKRRLRPAPPRTRVQPVLDAWGRRSRYAPGTEATAGRPPRNLRNPCRKPAKNPSKSFLRGGA
jgi:CheY-like chemotaxis protein